MKLVSVSRHSLNQVLLLRFLPPILVSIAVLIAWAVAAPWYALQAGGQEWVRSSVEAYQGVFEGRRQELEHRVGHLVTEVVEDARHLTTNAQDNPDHLLHLVSRDEEVIITDRQGQSFSLSWKDPTGRLSPTGHTSEAACERQGFQVCRGKLAIIARRDLPRMTGYRDIELIKFVDSASLFGVSQIIQSEAAIYAPGSDGKPLVASWRNSKDEAVLPALDAEDRLKILGIRPGEIRSGRATYPIPGYRGMFIHHPEPFNRGDSRISAFHAFVPLVNADGQVGAVMSAIIPEDILMRGVKRGMTGSLLIATLALVWSYWWIRRSSARIAAPLSAAVREIDQITMEIENTHCGTSHSKSHPSEIRVLRRAVHRLRRELHHAEEMRVRAESASRMAAVGEMAAGIAHEINNPIAIIHGLADELCDDLRRGRLSPEQAHSTARKIMDLSDRAARIARGFLQLSHDDALESAQEARLNTMVADTVDICRENLERHDVQLRVASISPEITLFCHPLQISQVLLNLINNSRDAVLDLPEKWIEVSAEATDNWVSIHITDSGHGIPDEVRAKLKRPFFTTKPAGKGTGLGLTIARKLVENHQGSITIDPASEHTRFTIRLPRNTRAKEAA